jgi:spore protease
MKMHMQEIFGEDFSGVCTIAPGVLGTTGIETASVIKGVSGQVNAGVIIAVDALAARSADRISTTIQISDTGIQPGAGVGNRREGLDRESLGVRVIAIGVPTVVDAATIAKDSLDEAFFNISNN